MTRVYTCYSEIADDVTGDKGQLVSDKENLDSLERRPKKIKRISVENLDEHCDHGLLTVKCPLLNRKSGRYTKILNAICIGQQLIRPC